MGFPADGGGISNGRNCSGWEVAAITFFDCTRSAGEAEETESPLSLIFGMLSLQLPGAVKGA